MPRMRSSKAPPVLPLLLAAGVGWLLLSRPKPPPPAEAPSLELGESREAQLQPIGPAMLTFGYQTNIVGGVRQWAALSEPAAGAASVVDPNANPVTLVFSVEGEYELGLTIKVTGVGGATVSDTFIVTVLPVPPPPPPDSAPSVIITGPQPEGFTVPAGEHWAINGLVTTPKSVVVFGRLSNWNASRTARVPAHLHFEGFNDAGFVGGPFAPVTDVGLWDEGSGILDLVGTPKLPWGFGVSMHPSWNASDEMVQAPLVPSEVNKTTGFRKHNLGDAVRQMPKPGSLTGETVGLPVLNLTRDVKISGSPAGYSHFRHMSNQKPILEYVEFEYMGRTELGRYPVHLHQSGDAVRGTSIIGCVVKRSLSHAFVPHTSHGTSWKNCISYDTIREPYWWDFGDITNDTLFEDCIAAWAHNHPRTLRQSGFFLFSGENNILRRCGTIGITSPGGGSAGSGGFHWPETMPFPRGDSFWFNEDCWSLANSHHGLFVWQNTKEPHTIATSGFFTSINSGFAGIEHGAYLNDYRYKNGIVHSQPGKTGMKDHAAPRDSGDTQSVPEADGYRASRRDCLFVGGLYGIELGPHPAVSDGVTLYKNLTFIGQTGAKFALDNNKSLAHPEQGFYDIVDCLKEGGAFLVPADVRLISATPNTRVRMQSGNQAWLIDAAGAITPIAPFYL